MSSEQEDRVAILEAIRQNAADAGLSDASITIGRDHFGGYRVRVVHPGLSGKSEETRRLLLLTGVERAVSDSELLTPDEEQWYGPVFTEGESQASWPDALSANRSTSDLTFVSDLDQDLTRPTIVTFYSLRGGVGRTTALASTAMILAGRGRRVLCIDMDLEAPGLSFLLGGHEPDTDQGVVPLLLALERGDEIDIRDHVQRVTDADELYCLPAGRLGVDYAERLRLISPETWYLETPNPLHRLIESAKESSLDPDLILIDARTGISPTSAPLLFDVSDMAVVCFFPHPQARRGTELLVRALLNSTSRRSTEDLAVAPEPRFIVAPVPPGPSAQRLQSRATEWIEEWLSSQQARRTADTGPLLAEELTHFISYSPEVAFQDRVFASGAVGEAYRPVADWLEQLLPQTTLIPSATSVKKRAVLAELDFATGTAEQQDSFLEDYVETRVSMQAVQVRYPLVIGRKGTGKTALFRWLLEGSHGRQEPVPILCPQAFRNQFPWVISADGFSSVEESHPDVNWRVFWSCYICLVLRLSLPEVGQAAPPAQFGTYLPDSIGEYGEVEIVGALRQMLGNPDAGILAARWLEGFGRRQGHPRFLLFDGLDTGFGSESAGRARRTRAVTGLLSLAMEIESRIPTYSFKIMLRYDIWQQLRFENKSHMYGRLVQLSWRDQTDFFKTVLKQGMRSSAFQQLTRSLGVGSDVEEWTDDDVRRAWNGLVGERMKGGKTTFTRNWVWNRLADGQGDRGPRALSQLFREAVEWERAEEHRNSYDRSVIRPRALVPSLEAVSVEAVQALLEEFAELDPLIETLRSLGRTPFDPDDVRRLDQNAFDQLELALEVGLLAVHEGTQDEIRRYRVPDLYRHALGMTRKGQA